MKLHNNKENRLLVNMAQELAYNKDTMGDIKNEIIGKAEIMPYEMAEVSLYLSNKYENMIKQPATDMRDNNEIGNTYHSAYQKAFFNNEFKDTLKQYYQNQLPDIQFKDDNLGRLVTVGDIRHSQYIDETPIVNMDENDNLSKGTPYKQDMYTCANLGVSEIYLNADDLDILKEEDNVCIGCTKQPDDTFTIKGITF